MQTFLPILVIGFVLAAVAADLLIMAAPEAVRKTEAAWMTGTFFAHRGLYSADQSIPENSLIAFDRAAEAGYGIELDVELTADDRLVVFHDDSLKRMTGLDRRLWDCTFEELSALSLAGTGQKIPLLAEVLDLVAGRVPLIVEIKDTKEAEKLCSMTWALLRDYSGRFCVESFNPKMVAWFRQHAPGVLRGQLSMRYRRDSGLSPLRRIALSNMLLNIFARPQFIAYQHTDADKLAFRWARRCGALTVAWTPSDEAAFRKSRKAFDTVIFEHILPGRPVTEEAEPAPAKP